MDSPPWEAVAASIARATGRLFQVDHADPVSGGCINHGFHIHGNGREFFAKLNAVSALSMFEAEAAGLREIAATRTVRVPFPICAGSDRERAWLVLEYLPLLSRGPRAMAVLGERLAAMHHTTRERSGWTRDNTIGSTLQINSHMADWGEFWKERRLGYQFELAARNGHGEKLQRKGAILLKRVPDLFVEHRPAASLLHGDLWGGNAGVTAGGEPIIFDPAVYYGDREADLAMTTLFGGFHCEFYSAYESVWPLAPGHHQRPDLYNLYHVLNHLNLFGDSYLGQAQTMIDGLLASA